MFNQLLKSNTPIRDLWGRLQDIMASSTIKDDELFKVGIHNTPLLPWEQGGFEDWLKTESQQKGRDVRLDLPTYDLQGLFLGLQKGEKGLQDPITGHSTDIFKKPTHPTFSDESKYSGVGNRYGGHWGQGYFVPSQHNIETTGLDELRKIFSLSGDKLIEPSYDY